MRCNASSADGDCVDFFKSRLGGSVLLRMKRARLQPGHTKLAQPFADRALVHIAQRLPVHAGLLRRLGSWTAFQHQRQRKNSPDLLTIGALAGNRPKL